MKKELFEQLVSLRITDEEWAHINYIFGKCSLSDVEFANEWVKLNFNRVCDRFEKKRVRKKMSLFKQLGMLRTKLLNGKQSNFSGEYAGASEYLNRDELNMIQSFLYKEGRLKEIYSSTIKTVLWEMDEVMSSHYFSSWDDYVMYS
jgi:hypothetical protein